MQAATRPDRGAERRADVPAQHQIGDPVETRRFPVKDDELRAVVLCELREAGRRIHDQRRPDREEKVRGKRLPLAARIASKGMGWPKEMVAVLTSPSHNSQRGARCSRTKAMRNGSSSYSRPQSRQCA